MSKIKGNNSLDVNMQKQKSTLPEWAKEPDKSHDADYDEDPQKWLKLQWSHYDIFNI